MMALRGRFRAAASGLLASLRLAAEGQKLTTLLKNIGKSSLSLVKRSKEPVSFPPHDLSLYSNYLDDLMKSGRNKFFTVRDQVTKRERQRNGLNIVLRHDLDAGYPDVALALCEIEKQRNVRSTVHILVDGILYDPTVFTQLVAKLRSEGFDVGLHTQSWMKKDYREALLDDIRTFETLYGFSPQTFSFHGAWPRTEGDMARRWRMVGEIDDVIKGTSLIGYTQQYHWIGEDSNIMGQPAPLSRHFFELERKAFLGGWSLLLTHDNHWRAN